MHRGSGDGKSRALRPVFEGVAVHGTHKCGVGSAMGDVEPSRRLRPKLVGGVRISNGDGKASVVFDEDGKILSIEGAGLAIPLLV